MEKNIITNTDSYKWGHYFAYPEGTEYVYSYIESRGSEDDELVLFGIQYYMKEYLSKPITAKNIARYKAIAKNHGDPIHDGWDYILEAHGGKLPICIESLPEGTVVNGKVVMAVIYNTDPKCGWLTNHMETSFLRAVW